MNLDAATAELICRMKEMFCDFSFKALWATIASCCSWLIGGTGEPILALAAMYGLDFVFGIVLAWRAGSLSASRFRGGLYKFLFYFLAIAAANLCDMALAQIPLMEHPVRVLMIMYLALGEFLSICAHISELNPNILPKGLLVRVRKYREDLFACRGGSA